MIRILSIVAIVIVAVLGIVFRDDPFRLQQHGMPADQVALEHRDSPYSHVTWVASHDSNYLQLRFFDKVEGGACLSPTWADLGRLAPETLAHLRMPEDYPVDQPPPGKRWPQDLPKPNPGSLSNTRYINLYPTAVLLNQRLMAAAGGDWRKAAPDILIVGLGSGIGAAMFAHHFPEASVTVVDIDQVVIDMVRDHYPMLRWLEDGQTTSDGRRRLELVQSDARQYLIFPETRTHDRDYDIVILDAYTTGSTIPPHLMTEEFFADVVDVMPDDGILLSNIIGSYTGSKRKVLGGAMRSMRTAGLEHLHNFPILQPESDQSRPVFEIHKEGKAARNNIVLASPSPLDPDANRAGWNAIRDFLKDGGPYPDLPLRRFRTMEAYLHQQGEGRYSTSYGLLEADGKPIDSDLVRGLQGQWGTRPWNGTQIAIEDQTLLRRTRDAVLSHAAQYDHIDPLGWNAEGAERVILSCTDWVLYARTIFASSVQVARDAAGDVFIHSGDNLVGPIAPEDRAAVEQPYWIIRDAPVFTDAQPNADILNL